MKMIIQIKERNQRIRNVLAKCSNCYDDATHGFHSYREIVAEFIQGSRVLDIGCGPNGGLAGILLELGVVSFTGVDISNEAVKSSRKQFPEYTFIWDDPVYVIKNLEKPHLIVSSGLFDPPIIRDDSYARELITAIHQKTLTRGYTIHSACSFNRFFNSLFLEQGFQRIEREYVALDFAIYQKNEESKT